MYSWKIYRDCDARLSPRPKLRKIVVECYVNGELKNRSRLFAWPWLKRALKKRKAAMKRKVEAFLAAEAEG